MRRALRNAIKRLPGINAVVADRDRWRDAFADAEVLVADLLRERTELRTALATAKLDQEAHRPGYVAKKAPGGPERHWRQFVVACRDYGRLQAGSAVLDVGCGVGGVARLLADELGPEGRYEGVDVDARSIAVCNATVELPNFGFTALDVQHDNYNPRGAILATEVALPFEDASFDLLVARSLFTHLGSAAATRYVTEFRRVLRPGGRGLITAFLLNDQIEARIAAGEHRSVRTFAHDRGDYRIDDPLAPLNAVAFQERFLLDLLARHNLPVTTVSYGKWSGAEDSARHQDLVVVEAVAQS